MTLAICYILHSEKLKKFYIGYTSDIIERRIEKHNSSYYGVNKYTHNSNDWKLFFVIECESKSQAIKVENHIKNMKSKKYIENLIKYPDISQKLLLKYYS